MAVVGMWAAAVVAQEAVERVFLLPFEIESDFGADNGDAIIGRVIPVNSIVVREDWKLFNVAMVTIADAPGGRPGVPGNPEPIPGPKVFGLGDLTNAVFYTRTTSEGLMWGVGVAVGIPIATDDLLGSGKWQAGPAVRLGHQVGAGDADLRRAVGQKLRNVGCPHEKGLEIAPEIRHQGPVAAECRPETRLVEQGHGPVGEPALVG